MEHNILSSKLDAISKSELGIHFDEEVIWSTLEDGLNNQRKVVEKRIILAACITLLVLLIPIKSANNDGGTGAHEVVEQVVIESASSPIPSMEMTSREPVATERKLVAVVDVKSKGVDLGIDPFLILESPILVPIEMPRKLQPETNHFMAEDVSKIQSTLGKSERKNQLRISVKTEVYTSSRNVQLGTEKIKIKLNGKN